MPTDPQQPHALLKRINAWALNDIGFDYAMVTGYHRPGDDHPDTLAIRAAAKDFFPGRPLDVIEGQGDYGGLYEFEFDFAIALDAKNGLIFSFVWNLAD